MNNAERAKLGREMAERFWSELRETFGDDEVRIGMVIGDLQGRNIKLHIELTKAKDRETREQERGR